VTPLELFEAHRELVGIWVAKLWVLHRYARLEVEDLEQMGMLGLWHAANRFDPARGVQFDTYASLCIRGLILSGVHRYRFGGGADPARLRLCGMDRDAEDVLDLFGEAPDNVFEQVAHQDDLAKVRHALDQIPSRDAHVLRARSEDRTLQQIGAEIGVSREMVRQIELKALPRLRRALIA
jgi:RNA polymerase sigma factor (sigma-70 family)